MSVKAMTILGGGLLARVPAGEKLWVDSNACVAQYMGSDARLFLPPDGGMWLTVPEAGDCYAICRNELHMEFGMAQLGICTVKQYPDQSFALGAHGRFAARLAHISGIHRLVQDQLPERMELPEVYRFLLASLRQTLVDAVERTNGPGQWQYENLWPRAKRQELSQTCWEGFFRVFFAHGLLLPRLQFNLEDINVPSISR